MKLLISKKEKKYAAIIVFIALIVLYIYNRMYVKITDIAYVNSEPYEIKIKCGFIFPERFTMLISDGEKHQSKNYLFEIKGLSLYKDGVKAITFKTDDEYTSTKTTPLIVI